MLSQRELTYRWLARINGRMKMNIAMSHPRFHHKTAKDSLLMQTRQRTLKAGRELPDTQIVPGGQWIYALWRERLTIAEKVGQRHTLPTTPGRRA